MSEVKVLWDVTRSYLRCQKGQGMVEYALILVFVSLVAVVGATTLGTSLQDYFTAIAGKIK